MRIQTFWRLTAGLVLVAFPLAGGADQESANPAADLSAATHAPEVLPAIDPTNGSTPEEIEDNLENAPAQVIAPAVLPANLNLSGPSAEVAKLAQAGMDESVMLAFVTNSSYIFQLDSDDIIYLKDVGVSEVIIAAMIQHDKTLQSNLPNPTAAEPP